MIITLDSFRYLVALGTLLIAPPGLLIWFLIHPLAHFWRRTGVLRSYLCFASLMILLAWGIWQVKGWLLLVEYGFHPALIVLSFLCLCAAAFIALKRGQQLTFPTVIGIPELSNPIRPRVLATQGVYARVRNPRYLETLLFVLGCAFFANYLAVYLAWFISLPILHLVVLLEERELTRALGDEYLAYCKRVPRYLPKPKLSDPAQG